MKRLICILCVITVVFCNIHVSFAETTVEITLSATSYMTDGILVPDFSAPEGVEISYRYLMADKPDAPQEYWEEIVYENPNLSASGTVSAENPGKAYLLLSHNQANKYVRLELTVDGVRYLSEPTPRIGFTPNLLNNSGLSSIAVDGESMEVYGWSDGVYKNGAVYSSGNTDNVWYNRFDFPLNFTGVKYNVSGSYKKAVATVRNFRTVLGGTESGNITCTEGEDGYLGFSTALSAGKSAESYIAFRLCTSAAAGGAYFYIKDVSVSKQAPYVSDVRIGYDSDRNVYRGEYTYNSELDYSGAVEGSSIYKWYYSSNAYGPWTEIEGENNAELIPKNNLEGKYIRFAVTPVNDSSIAGTTISSIEDVIVTNTEGVRLKAVDDSYRTDGILYFEYTGAADTIEYSYMVSDSPEVDSNWAELDYQSEYVKTRGEISAEKSKNAYLLLSPKLYGKYIRVKITLSDGEILYSNPSERIEFSPNIFNNPTFSKDAVDADGNIMGWFDKEGDTIELGDDKDSQSTSGSLKVRPNAGELGYDFGTYTVLPEKLIDIGLKYNISYDVYKITSGGSNFRMKFGNNGMLIIGEAPNTYNNKWMRISNKIESNLGNANSSYIAFSMSGSAGGAAGQINVDNVSIIPVAPYVSDVSVAGKAVPLRTVTGTYNYVSEYDASGEAEGESIYSWFIGDSQYGPWEKVEDASGNEFEIPQSAENKYIKFEVTPVNSSGVKGKAQNSVIKVGLSSGSTERTLDEKNPYLKSMRDMAKASISAAESDIESVNPFYLAWAYTAYESYYTGDETVKDYLISALSLKCAEMEETPASHWVSEVFDSIYMIMQYEDSTIPSETVEKWKTQLKPSFELCYTGYTENKTAWTARAANVLAQDAAVLELGYLICGEPKYDDTAKECAYRILNEYQKDDGGYTYLDNSAATKVYLDFTALYLGRYYQLSKDEVAGKSLKKFADYAEFYSINGNLESSSTPWWKKTWGTSGSLYGMEVAAGISGSSTAKAIAKKWESAGKTSVYTYYAMYFWDDSIPSGIIPSELNKYSSTIQGPVLRRGNYQVVMTGAPYSDTGLGISVASESSNFKWDGYLETAAIAILGSDATAYQNTSGIVSGTDDLYKQDYVIGDDFIALAKTHDLKHAYTGSLKDPSGKGFKSTQIYYADESGVGGWIEVEATSARSNIDGPFGVIKVSDIVSIDGNNINSNSLKYTVSGSDISGITNEGNTAYISFANSGKRNYTAGERFGFGIAAAQTDKAIPKVEKIDGSLVKIRVDTAGSGETYLIFNPTDKAASVNIDYEYYAAYTGENQIFDGDIIEPYQLIVLRNRAKLYFENDSIFVKAKYEQDKNIRLFIAVFDGDKLETVQVEDEKITADEDYNLEKTIDSDLIPYTLEAFLWERDTLVPLAGCQRRALNE